MVDNKACIAIVQDIQTQKIGVNLLILNTKFIQEKNVLENKNFN